MTPDHYFRQATIAGEERSVVMKQADEIAGQPTIGGGKVMASVRPDAVLNGIAARGLGRPIEAGQVSPLRGRELGFLTLTADRLLLMTFKAGVWHPTANGVMADVPRSDVAEIVVGKAVGLNPIDVRFVDGSVWQVHCDKANLGKLRALASELAPS